MTWIVNTCNVHVVYKIIFSNKFNLVWQELFSYIMLKRNKWRDVNK